MATNGLFNKTAHSKRSIKRLRLATVEVKIGKGIQFLTNPDLALDAPSAYQLMSYCLRTGYGFANHRTLGDFIYGAKANYAGARSMVNGIDKAQELERLSNIFEDILLRSRL